MSNGKVNPRVAAAKFKEYEKLEEKQQGLLREYFKAGDEQEAARMWKDLTEQYNDKAATFLAISHSLNLVIFTLKDNYSITGFQMVKSIRDLCGDRIKVEIDGDQLRQWREAGGEFSIIRHDGKIEQGHVRFDAGDLGGSLHKCYEKQGYTSVSKSPRLQWNY